MFPHEILELPNLQVLDLSSNYISAVPTFRSMENDRVGSPYMPESWKKSLKLLDLSHNLIGQFQISITQLESLEELYFGWNQIGLLGRELPKEIANMKNLRSSNL